MIRFLAILLVVGLAFGETKPAWIRSQKDNEFTLDKKKIEKEFKSPAKILEALTMKFIPGEDKQIFIEVVDLRKGNILEPLGIQKGDILRSLNGERVSMALILDPQRTSREWLNKKRYELELSRKGKLLKIFYNVK